MESCPTQAVLPLVGLAAENVIPDRYRVERGPSGLPGCVPAFCAAWHRLSRKRDRHGARHPCRRHGGSLPGDGRKEHGPTPLDAGSRFDIPYTVLQPVTKPSSRFQNPLDYGTSAWFCYRFLIMAL
ncbi:MAG: hypothetical protein ACQESR_26120 [Planctomycetota bacterium]